VDSQKANDAVIFIGQRQDLVWSGASGQKTHKNYGEFIGKDSDLHYIAPIICYGATASGEQHFTHGAVQKR
jgi:hypothetical protein